MCLYCHGARLVHSAFQDEAKNWSQTDEQHHQQAQARLQAQQRNQRHGAQRGRPDGVACGCGWCGNLRESHCAADLDSRIGACKRSLSHSQQFSNLKGVKFEEEVKQHRVKVESELKGLEAESHTGSKSTSLSPLLSGTCWDLMDRLLCDKVDGHHQLKCVFTLLSDEEREKINQQLPDGHKISPCQDCGWDKVFGSDFEDKCCGLHDAQHEVTWQEYEICRVAGDKQEDKRVLTDKSGTRLELYNRFKVCLVMYL